MRAGRTLCSIAPLGKNPRLGILVAAAAIATSGVAGALAQEPAVTAAAPDAPRVVVGERVVIALSGSDLGPLTDAAVEARGRPVPGLAATLAPPDRDPGRRDVTIEVGRDAAPARDLELVVSFPDALRRPRRIATPVRLEITPPAGVPAIALAAPSLVRVLPGDPPVTIDLGGWNLDALVGVAARSAGGAAAGGIEARLDVGSPGFARLELFGAKVEPGSYAVFARWRGGELALPVEIEVEAPPVAEPPGFVPVALTTELLRYPGRRFVPVSLTTGPLRYPGRRFVPVSLTTEPLRYPGRRFVPVHVQTGALLYPGRGEENQ